MHVYYKFGLFIIFILSVSTCFTRAAPAVNANSTYDDDYADDYNDYYAENESDVSTETTNRLKPNTTTPTPQFTTQISELDKPTRSNHVLEPSCPKACTCLQDFKFVHCSNANLIEVPSDIPATALMIDLSQNHIEALRANDFANCSKVREINLSNNELHEVNEEVFRHLNRLERLRLSNNHLSQLAPDTFAGAVELRQLDLSHNPITLRSDGSFLNQPSLLELSCQNCSWTQVYDETFANTTSLTALKMDQNDFKQKINTKAFATLSNLIKLKLPELKQSSVEELCNLLKSIDNISFKNFDVTCYLLVLNGSYNESLIRTTDPPYLQQTTETKSNVTAHNNSNRNVENQSRPNMEGHASSNLTKTNNSDTKTLTAGILGGEAATPPGSEEDKPYQVPMSQETINIMLICIIVIAVIGIIIGIICRKDVGGIKTKCCRTRKPEPKDQVHPTEEIPLNKLA